MSIKNLFASRLLFLLLIVSLSPAALAVERLKIGLALSGGGARGMAHVGVLKILEQEHVPIDYIAGTSMGSIVGGLYASGMSPEEIEHELRTMDWDSVFEDKENRSDRSFRRKQDDQLYLAKARIGVKDRGIKVSTALIQGQKFDLELNRLMQHVAGVSDFDTLYIPFRAVATDLTKGKDVVLGSGNLQLAMRASMSVPAAFAGVEIDGRLLVDGGMANNLPISVVRDMGADIVIAVDISSPLLGRDKLDSALNVLEQLSGFLTRRNTERQIASLGDRDILLVPELKEVGSASFAKVSIAIEAGMASALASREKIAALAVPVDESKNRAELMVKNARLASVSIVSDSKIDESVLRHKLGVQAGENFDRAKLEQGISQIYGMGIFESVRYELTEKDGQQAVVVRAKEKSWGTDFLQFGAEASSDGGTGGSFFNFAVAFTKQPLNSLNGEWRTSLQIGEELGIASEIYQPLDSDAAYFIHGRLEYGNKIFRLFEGTQAVAEYKTTQLLLDFSGGINFDNWGELRLGYRAYDGELELVTGLGLLPDQDYNGGELYTRFTLDELDNLYFPREGGLFRVEGLYSREFLGADDDFEQLYGSAAWASSWGDNTLIFSGEFGASRFDAAPLQNNFRLGGFLRLSGLEQYQLTGQHLLLAGAAYTRRLYQSKFVPVYAGVSIEAGNTWESSDQVSLNDLLFSGSLFLGADTPVGPLYLAYGRANTGQDSIYLFLGQAWARRQ